MIELRVIGVPVPQGSKTAGRTRSGHAFVRDANPGPLKRWRNDVTVATRNATGATPGWKPYDEALDVWIRFYFTRPDSHYGTGRNAHLLKPSAPLFVAVTPDIDKCVRAILDGLADGRAYVNDSRVASLNVAKLYADHGVPPGAHIRIRPIGHTAPPSSL